MAEFAESKTGALKKARPLITELAFSAPHFRSAMAAKQIVGLDGLAALVAECGTRGLPLTRVCR